MFFQGQAANHKKKNQNPKKKHKQNTKIFFVDFQALPAK